MDVKISPFPPDLKREYQQIFTDGSLAFLKELNGEFESEIEKLYENREYRKLYYCESKNLPKFKNSYCKNTEWKISEIPVRLQNRRIDLGDVSPSNTNQYLNALNQDVQGIQVDFDDGHCPNWYNQILGHFNILSAIQKAKNINDFPILMLRPRAWNITEHNVTIKGKHLPGALVDFGLLMYHNSKKLHANNAGPYFYLSKLESASEARLWNEIFIWAQRKLNLPHGTIKCCVLIENILATFELEEILYELKDHCMGLNCGMWDYIASIIAKFGERKEFVLADRQKLSMKDEFLKTYMEMIIQICHKRGALATGGMIAKVTSEISSENFIIETCRTKLFEITSGIDGFLIYDTKLVSHTNKLWQDNKNIILPNQKLSEDSKTISTLLQLPNGTINIKSLNHNVQVTVLFIYNWLNGNGHFVHNGFVEDSATAEISRSQIWQWIKHESLMDNNKTISPKIVNQAVTEFLEKNRYLDSTKLKISATIAMELFLAKNYPDFITTYLNDHPELHMKYDGIKSKL